MLQMLTLPQGTAVQKQIQFNSPQTVTIQSITKQESESSMLYALIDVHKEFLSVVRGRDNLYSPKLGFAIYKHHDNELLYGK